MKTSRRGSILLYVVFLSTFLLAFFASFRTQISAALADSASEIGKARAVAVLADAVARSAFDPLVLFSVSDQFSYEPVGNDGRLFKRTVLHGSPYRFEIVAKAGAASFGAYVSSGGATLFEVFDAAGAPVSHVTVSSGSEVDVPLPATSTGFVTVTALEGRSLFEVDRYGADFRYPDSAFRVYRLAGRAKESLGTYRVPSD